ncbi:hypothetical protein NUKP82_39210 [Klebsiella variicola]|nr:hypothetical protein NUKP82_39210 [Klebsiella variicola]
MVPEAAFRYWRCRWDRGPRQHSGADREVGTVVPGSIPALTVKVGPWSQRQHSGTGGADGTVVPGNIPALTGKLGPWSQAAFRH